MYSGKFCEYNPCFGKIRLYSESARNANINLIAIITLRLNNKTKGKMNINFESEYWELKVKDCLEQETDFLSDMDIDIEIDDKLWFDTIAIDHVKNQLRLYGFMEINQEIPDVDLAVFCNQLSAESMLFKPYLKYIDSKKCIIMDLHLYTSGGVAFKALKETIEMCWLDMHHIEYKLEESDWLQD